MVQAENPGYSTLRVLTFEVGAHLFGVRADQVARIVPSGTPVDGEVNVVDAVGILGTRKDKGSKGCLIILSSRGPGGEQVAITGSRAGEIRSIDPESLLPLPSYLFRDENPFQGVSIPKSSDEDDSPGDSRALFLLAGPERLLGRADDG